jgi:hypothetical protein
MTDKQPSVQNHLHFGRAIKDFERALRQMATGSVSGLGVWRFRKSSAEAKAISKTMDAVGNLKNIMDDQICGMVGYREPYGKDASRFYYGDEDPRP